MDYTLQTYIKKLPSNTLALYVRQNATPELLNDPNSVVSIVLAELKSRKTNPESSQTCDPGFCCNAE